MILTAFAEYHGPARWNPFGGCMTLEMPEKARLLKKLTEGNFNVPDFLYVPAKNFENEDFGELEKFLEKHRESYKILARSAHPKEEFYRGGTFDSLPTYADVGGVKYARKRIIRMALTTRRLSFKRQQKFYHAPEIDPEATGIIVMPLIEGTSVMAKMVGDYWEFGYCQNEIGKLQDDPHITQTPHNIYLLEISKKVQDYLGFKCEIEYIIDKEDQIHVVQAKDISGIEMLEQPAGDQYVRVFFGGFHQGVGQLNRQKTSPAVAKSEAVFIQARGARMGFIVTGPEYAVGVF